MLTWPHSEMTLEKQGQGDLEHGVVRMNPVENELMTKVRNANWVSARAATNPHHWCFSNLRPGKNETRRGYHQAVGEMLMVLRRKRYP